MASCDPGSDGPRARTCGAAADRAGGELRPGHNSGHGGGHHSNNSNNNDNDDDNSGPGGSSASGNGGGSGGGNDNNSVAGGNSGPGSNGGAGGNDNGQKTSGGLASGANPFNAGGGRPSLGLGFNNNSASLGATIPFGAPHHAAAHGNDQASHPKVTMPFVSFGHGTGNGNGTGGTHALAARATS